MEEIEFLVDGKLTTLDYWVSGNMVTIYLPGGDNRSTALNGLDPANAIKVHIRSFYKDKEITFT